MLVVVWLSTFLVSLRRKQCWGTRRVQSKMCIIIFLVRNWKPSTPKFCFWFNSALTNNNTFRKTSLCCSKPMLTHNPDRAEPKTEGKNVVMYTTVHVWNYWRNCKTNKIYFWISFCSLKPINPLRIHAQWTKAQNLKYI